MRGTSATSIKVLPVPPNWIYATFMCRCKFVELRRCAARVKNQQDNESRQGNNGATSWWQHWQHETKLRQPQTRREAGQQLQVVASTNNFRGL
ncbi:hypothetical protein ACLKA7_003840 [Drosophila subpalustris]